jgi:hypothetical protein
MFGRESTTGDRPSVFADKTYDQPGLVTNYAIQQVDVEAALIGVPL